MILSAERFTRRNENGLPRPRYAGGLGRVGVKIMTSEKNMGIVFNTQKFSIHDGNGIRTLIFMKGCPLRCLWCSNPESQRLEPQLMDVKSNCVGCGKCVVLCPLKAVDPETFDVDRSKCDHCGKCAERCYANAKKMAGKRVSVQELMDLIEKDRIFYENSGGGVTIGGGEPTMQFEFVRELLQECKSAHIHTAIETCGFGEWEKLSEIFRLTDQIFFDLKAMDPNLHKRLTGADNASILENARNAAKLGKKLIFRIPLVPGCNDSGGNIEATGAFVAGLSGGDSDISVEILPYHDFGKDKYRWLNMEYALGQLNRPEEETVAECRKILMEQKCSVI